MYLLSRKTQMQVSVVSVSQIICLRMQTLRKRQNIDTVCQVILFYIQHRQEIISLPCCFAALRRHCLCHCRRRSCPRHYRLLRHCRRNCRRRRRLRLSPFTAASPHRRCHRRRPPPHVLLLVACPRCCQPPPLSLLLLPPPPPPLFPSPSVTASTSASINAAFTCRSGGSSGERWRGAMVKSIVGRWSRWEVCIYFRWFFT